MNVTAIATMHIVLHLESKTTGRRVSGSPLAFSLRKRCEAATHNAGVYTSQWRRQRGRRREASPLWVYGKIGRQLIC